MLWKDRITAAALAVAAGAAALAAVTFISPEKPEFTPGQIAEGVTYEATGVASDEVVARLGGNGAEAELFTFWLGNECVNLESYGIDVSESWDTAIDGNGSLEDFVREDVLLAIKQQLVLENLCDEYGVTIAPDDEAELAAERESYLERYGGEEGYLAELYKLGISEAGFDRLSRTDYLYSALYQAYLTPGSALYASDDVLHAYAAGADYITADHLLLMTVDPATREPLDGETVAAKRALAEELLARLRASGDPIVLFDELADEYGEDPGRAAYPRGYTFTYGTMVEAFDSAARALGENEISDIVESEFGYHILLRRPLDVAAAVEAVRPEYFEVFFRAELEGAEMEVSPAVEKLDVRALYAALRAAQGADAADGG